MRDLFRPCLRFFLKWSMPRKVSTRLMVSMKVSPSMLGYWNFWKLSEFGRKSNLTSVFVGMYNVHVETTSGPDMCASFSRFYSFNLSTFSKDTRLLKLHGSFTNSCSMKRKVVKLTRMWIKFDPWMKGGRRRFVKLMKSLGFDRFKNKK